MNKIFFKYLRKTGSEFYILFVIIPVFLISGCSSSNQQEDNNYDSGNGDIIKTAKIEQQNEMYSTISDSVYIYWMDYSITGLKNRTKCNIFALNTLFKAGFKCPAVYTLTHDLFNKEKFNDVFPVIEIQSPGDILEGDLIIWDGHVIIFEAISKTNNQTYAVGIWGGSQKNDNGVNIMNNVAYGKYKLDGTYIVRRPQKR